MSKVDGPSKTMTYEKLLAQATDRLIMAGVTDAQLDAWYLLEDTFGISRADYFLKKRECPEMIPDCWICALVPAASACLWLSWEDIL